MSRFLNVRQTGRARGWVRRHRRRVGPWVLCAAAVGTGCSDRGPQAASVSKDEFIQRADEICESASDEYEDALADYGAEPTTRRLPDAFMRSLDALDQAVDEIRLVGFPDADAGELDELFDDLARAIEDSRSIVTREDPADLVEVIEEEDPFANMTTRLSSYGFTADCANLF